MNSDMRFEGVQDGGCDLGRMDWAALLAAMMGLVVIIQDKKANKKRLNVLSCLGGSREIL